MSSSYSVYYFCVPFIWIWSTLLFLSRSCSYSPWFASNPYFLINWETVVAFRLFPDSILSSFNLHFFAVPISVYLWERRLSSSDIFPSLFLKNLDGILSVSPFTFDADWGYVALLYVFWCRSSKLFWLSLIDLRRFSVWDI